MDNKNHQQTRISTYSELHNYLHLTDSEIELIANTHNKIRFNTALAQINNKQVFIKKIPLTNLEALEHNYLSTKNLFNLPPYYQYGAYSFGFGAWRELRAHIMTTDWVLSNQCIHFPLLYHWRILERNPRRPIDCRIVDKMLKYWGKLESIKFRIQEIIEADLMIVLFIEYIPNTLRQWIPGQLKARSMSQSLLMVESDMLKTISFMESQGMIHFDATLHNILTDGKILYFTDFGLASSDKFDLSSEELYFLSGHCYFDKYTALSRLVDLIVCIAYPKRNLFKQLNRLAYKDTIVPYNAARTIMKNYIKIAAIFKKFYRDFAYNKFTPFPQMRLKQLLHALSKGRIHHKG